MAARLLLVSATISIALLAPREHAAAQGGTAHVDLTGAMSESFDVMLVGNQSYDAQGRLNLYFLGRNQEEFQLRLNPPITTGTHEVPASYETDASNITIVPSTQPPFGNLSIVSSTSTTHENSCTVTIDFKNEVGARGSFRCTFDKGQIQAVGTFATTDAPAAAGPPPESMELGLACDRNDLQEYGRVSCNAAVSNIHEGAQITYRWTVDGTDRNETGRDLSLDDISVGDHTIAVSAFDQTTTTSLGSQSVSLTRYPPGTPAAEEAGKFGSNLKPLLAGAAIAIAIALGGIISKGRKPKTPDPDTLFRRPKTPVKPAPKRPVTGPEDLPADSNSDKQRKRSKPTLTVRIILRPSVLVQQLYNSGENKILGDTVDFTFVGYELHVGPYGQWDIDNSMPRYGGELHAGNLHAIDATWTVSGGEWKPVNEFAKIGEADFRNLPSNDPWATRTDSNNAVIFTRKWHEKDDAMTVAVKVRARVRSTDQTEIDYVEAIDVAAEPIVIVGAKPDLSFTAKTPSRVKLGISADEGGTITGSADGKDRIRIDPVLYLFDGIYAGGLQITDIDERIAPKTPSQRAVYLEDFFEVIRDKPKMTVAGELHDDESRIAMMREGLTLRCRCRLGDERPVGFPEDGFKLRMTIEPTGKAYGLETLGKRFDWVLRDHYKACAAQYKLNPLSASRLVTINLVPAKIEVLAPEPNLLPKVAALDERFVTRIKARICNHYGDPIDGAPWEKDIDERDIKQWHFRFWYDPPSEEWRRKVDPGMERESGPTLNASGIDRKTGEILFDDSSGACYDHAKYFTKKLSPDIDYAVRNVYILGQTCDIQTEFRAYWHHVEALSQPDWHSYSGKSIHIDVIDEETVTLKLKVIAESGDPIAGAKVTAGARENKGWSSTDENIRANPTLTHAVTDALGEVSLELLRIDENPYHIRVNWRTEPWNGNSVAAGREWQTEEAIRNDESYRILNEQEVPRRPGSLIEQRLTTHVVDDDRQTIVLHVTSEWSLLPRVSASHGPSFLMVVSAGVMVVTAVLSNEGKTATTQPGGLLELFTNRRVTERCKARKIVYGARYLSIGKSMDDTGFGVSDLGSTPFETRTPLVFDDFHMSGGHLEQLEFNLVRSTGNTIVMFEDITTRPQEIDISGWGKGLPNLSAQLATGVWWFPYL